MKVVVPLDITKGVVDGFWKPEVSTVADIDHRISVFNPGMAVIDSPKRALPCDFPMNQKHSPVITDKCLAHKVAAIGLIAIPKTG